MLATVVATTATLSSNSCKITIVFLYIYFRSAETVRHERHVFRVPYSYKRALALRNSRLSRQAKTFLIIIDLPRISPPPCCVNLQRRTQCNQWVNQSPYQKDRPVSYEMPPTNSLHQVARQDPKYRGLAEMSNYRHRIVPAITAQL